MTTPATARRVADAVERLSLHGPEDLRELRAAVLAELGRVIEFHWYAWVLTDPATEVGVDPLAAIPDLEELPTVVRLKYLTAVGRWTGLESAMTLGDRRSDSPLWTGVQRTHGVADVASLVLRDRHGCWAFLDLWSRNRLDDGVVGLLDRVAPTVTAGIRRRVAAGLVVPDHRAVPMGAAVMLLDDDLRVVGRSPASSARSAGILPAADGREPVPAAAFNVAAQLLAQEHGVSDLPPLSRVHVGGGEWVTLRASRVPPSRLIAVSLEVSSAQERLDLFVRAHALSQRESELVGLLATGFTTAEVASGMTVSEHTVQDHLKSIFDKAGVRSRRDLLARALGARP